MKKALLLFLIFGMISNVSFAQQEPSNTDQPSADQQIPQGLPQPPSMPDLGKLPEPTMFVPPSAPVIGTFSDGSFVLLAGSKIYRYDSQMKLVKEVSVPYDVPGLIASSDKKA